MDPGALSLILLTTWDLTKGTNVSKCGRESKLNIWPAWGLGSHDSSVNLSLLSKHMIGLPFHVIFKISMAIQLTVAVKCEQDDLPHYLLPSWKTSLGSMCQVESWGTVISRFFSPASQSWTCKINGNTQTFVVSSHWDFWIVC